MTGALKGETTRSKRGVINKRLILTTSAAMFFERGYDRTTLDDIARTLSIKKPSLYYHFASKEDILLECITTAFNHLKEEMAQCDDPGLDGRRRVELFLRLYLDVISHDIGVSMVIADERAMSPEVRAIYHGHRRVVNQALESLIRAGVEDGSIFAPETRYTANAIFGMFNWISRWNGGGGQAADLSLLFDRYISIIFDGIGAK